MQPSVLATYGIRATNNRIRRTDTISSQHNQSENEIGAVQAVMHALEGLNERLVCDAYKLDEGDVQAVMDETGVPASWHPMIVGYDDLPALPAGLLLPSELAARLREGQRVTLVSHELERLKARLRALYGAGDTPKSAPTSGDDEEASGDGNGDEVEALGAHIPVPAETLLEEIAQQARVHPISVYHLLREMRERERLVSQPELRRHLEDYVSITILRLLGYHWPEQDAYEREHGPIIDPSLVRQDGIIPLVPCGNEPTVQALIAARLECDFGEDGAARSEQEFQQYVGRDIHDWLRREFFKRHTQQFKSRPIAWHLVSPERTFEALVFYHRLNRDTLGRLRNQYVGALLSRLRGEQQSARDRKNAAEVSRLQLAIEDVEEFNERIAAIERGDELRYRVRCRWKGEEKDGRPGPYTPDIDDGVKVNIRPFQEAGLLAVKKVIAKW